MTFHGFDDVTEEDFRRECVPVVDDGLVVRTIPAVHCEHQRSVNQKQIHTSRAKQNSRFGRLSENFDCSNATCCRSDSRSTHLQPRRKALTYASTLLAPLSWSRVRYLRRYSVKQASGQGC